MTELQLQVLCCSPDRGSWFSKLCLSGLKAQFQAESFDVSMLQFKYLAQGLSGLLNDASMTTEDVATEVMKAITPFLHASSGEVGPELADALQEFKMLVTFVPATAPDMATKVQALLDSLPKGAACHPIANESWPPAVGAPLGLVVGRGGRWQPTGGGIRIAELRAVTSL